MCLHFIGISSSQWHQKTFANTFALLFFATKIICMSFDLRKGLVTLFIHPSLLKCSAHPGNNSVCYIKFPGNIYYCSNFFELSYNTDICKIILIMTARDIHNLKIVICFFCGQISLQTASANTHQIH